MANNVSVTLDTTATHSEDTVRSMWGVLSLSTSYSTGGDLITPGQLGLGILARLVIEPTSGWIFQYNATNGSVQVFGQSGAGSTTTPAALAEASSGTNISTVSAKFMAFGY